MLDESVISLILWVPFGIVFIIAAAIFCVMGYRQGLWRALGSLFATMLAAIGSVLLAIPLAEPVGNWAWNSLAPMLITEDTAMMESLLESLVQAGLTIVLFPAVLFILVILCKVAAMLIFGKRCKTENTGMKFAGLGVRLADAFLYTMLLLFPLYGTLGAFLPSIQEVASLLPMESAGISVLETLGEHPLTRFNSLPPVRFLYENLSGVETENGKVNVVSAAESMAGAMKRLEALRKSMEAGEVDPEQVKETVHYFRENVVHQDWAYSLYREGYAMIAPQMDDPDTSEKLRFMIGLADMDKADFQLNANAVLDFWGFLLEEPERFEKLDSNAVNDPALLLEVGKLFNASEHACALYDYLLQDAISGSRWESLLEDYTATAEADSNSQLQDAVVLLSIRPEADDLDNLGSILRLPGIDKEAVKHAYWEYARTELLPADSAAIDFDYGTVFDENSDWKNVVRYTADHDQFLLSIWNMLEVRSQAPMDGSTASDWLRSYMAVSNLGIATYNYGGGLNKENMDWILNTLGEDFYIFQDEHDRLAAGTECYTLADSCRRLLKSGTLSQVKAGDNSLWAIAYMMENFIENNPWQTGLPKDMPQFIYEYVSGEAGYASIKTLVEEQGFDPLGIGDKFSFTERRWLKAAIDPSIWSDDVKDALLSQYKLSEINEMCDTLLQFFGIE